MPKQKQPRNLNYQANQSNQQAQQSRQNQQIDQKLPGANNFFETAEELANKPQKGNKANNKHQKPEQGV